MADKSFPVWMQVPSVPELEVSDTGDVRRTYDKRLLKQVVDSLGYRSVAHTSSRYYVHRLVGEAFLGAAPAQYDEKGRVESRAQSVRFLSGDRSDCSPSNLYLGGTTPSPAETAPGPTVPLEVGRAMYAANTKRPFHHRSIRSAVTGVYLPIPSSNSALEPDPLSQTVEDLFDLNPHLSESDISVVLDYFYTSSAALARRSRLNLNGTSVAVRINGVVRRARFAGRSNDHPALTPPNSSENPLSAF